MNHVEYPCIQKMVIFISIKKQQKVPSFYDENCLIITMYLNYFGGQIVIFRLNI